MHYSSTAAAGLLRSMQQYIFCIYGVRATMQNAMVGWYLGTRVCVYTHTSIRMCSHPCIYMYLQL